jgi:tetratricopeptide (TPR) repeat protein
VAIQEKHTGSFDQVLRLQGGHRPREKGETRRSVMDLRKLLRSEEKSTLESVIARAVSIADTGHPETALVYLRDSGFAEAPQVLALARRTIDRFRDQIPASLLAETFLDPLWCQCDACDFTWLEPLPDDPSRSSKPVNGLKCMDCGHYFCANCISSLDLPRGSCGCGGALQRVISPNGRTIRYFEGLKRVEEGDSGWPSETVNNGSHLDLFFGFYGKLPIALDSSIENAPAAAPEDLLRWAESLIDNGLYYHAHLQLLSLSESIQQFAKVKWLRARLLIVQLRNARERSRRDYGCDLGDFILESQAEIKNLLREAREQEPDFGSAWLTTAEYHLNEAKDQDERVQALAFSERAHELLGRRADVLLAFGRALRANGQLDRAASTLSLVPSNSVEGPLAEKERGLAEMEQLSQGDTLEPSASWHLGKRFIDEKKNKEALRLFERLATELPQRPEGHCGLARLVFLADDLPQRERLARTQQLCAKALACRPEFGPAHELMGMILRSAQSNGVHMTNPLTAMDHFRRAIELDMTCDVAAAALADDFIERSEPQKAFELLEKAAALNTRLDGVYFKLAVFYQAMRQPQKQAEAYRRAKDLAPHLELATDYKQKILDLCGFQY